MIDDIQSAFFQTNYTIGHTGHGCQHSMMDVGNGLSVAYTANGLKVSRVTVGKALQEV